MTVQAATDSPHSPFFLILPSLLLFSLIPLFSLFLSCHSSSFFSASASSSTSLY